MRLLLLVLFFASAVVNAADKVRLYVEPIENKGGTISLRDALIEKLKKTKPFEVVKSPADADRVISGFGETYVKGYVTRNIRVRYKNNDSLPIYGGYLSIEFKDGTGDTLWSDLATPSRFTPGDIGGDLAGQIVSALSDFLESSKKEAK